VPANVSGELGVRLVLGDEWAKAEGKFVLGFPGEATFVCEPPEPFHVDYKIDYTGLSTVLFGSTKWFGSFTQRWKLTDPIKPWRTGTLFRAKGRAPGRSR
jgi:hypothetical protein